jgi:hypothetical protein
VNITSILYGIAIAVVKLSILLQYLKIFVPNRKSNMRLFVCAQSLIWGDLAFYTASALLDIFACTPREKIWNKLITDGHCANTDASGMAGAIFNVFSDFVILLLPMVSIWKLHLAPRKKFGIFAIFATGLL